MLNYEEISKTKTKLTNSVKKELTLVTSSLNSQEQLIDSINIYVQETSTLFNENEILKNMLQSGFDVATLQIKMNVQDLQTLIDTLNEFLENKTCTDQDVISYNALYAKAENNIKVVSEILQKTIASFDQLSSEFSKADNKPIKTSVKKNLATAKNNIMDNISSKVKIEDSSSNISYNIKEMPENNSSDLLCLFPKSDKDILAISTAQDTYKVSFNQINATIFIEEEDFNFTLKTIGVQISNASNVLLVYRKASGFFIVTNMMIDVPDFVNVSKINRNKSFIEIGVSNPSINISVDSNILSFVEKFNDSAMPEPVIRQQSYVSETITETIDLPPVAKSIEKPIEKIVEKPVENINSKILEKEPERPVEKRHEPERPREIDEGPRHTLLQDNNTLIIAENDKKVILPYKIRDVEEQFKKNRKKYDSIEDLIKTEYIVSTENFKSPIKSRFREAYQLIKKKEHGHLKEALDLGFELMFQSNLNPAVIAACKNLRELDIYLDCLDDNELDKFSCFDIVYNVPPTKSGKKQK